jgi:arylsulfatase A-like enzyme
MAGNTPFKKWKREQHLGGVRDPMIICWPKGIKAKGDIRHQFVHAIDIVPMVLDVLGVEPPDQIKGVTQNPMHGASFAHTFDDPKAPAKRKTQYFEMFGYRALYHDGWWAVAPHLPFGTPINEKVLANLKWELYKADEDFSQSTDLAAKYPEKVKEMDQRWWTEAAKYDVLPWTAAVHHA